MKSFLFVLTIVAAAAANAAMTAKTMWTQRWPWQTKVDIDFTLAGGEKCDVEVKASFTTNGVPSTLDLEHAGLVGDTWELAPGTYHLEWDPAGCGMDAKTLKDFVITVTPVENAATARAWLVLDCETGSHCYVALGDEPQNGAGWPWASDSNDYRARYMVFRRIPAGRFSVGHTQAEIDYLNGLRTSGNAVTSVPSKHEVELTSDYYIGIYQVTLAQNYRWTSRAMADYIKNQVVAHLGDWSARGYPCFQRGSNSVEGVNWPATKFAVTSNSHIGEMRTKFGNRFHIDLPTAAQWMHAARPSTDWLWYDTPTYGGGTTLDDRAAISNVVNTISRGFRTQAECQSQGYGSNLGAYSCVTAGRFQPNSFGIYDTLVNRREMVLDAWTNLAAMESETVDPVGPVVSTGVSRITLSSYNQDGVSNPIGFLQSRVTTLSNDAAPNANNEMTCRYAIHLRPPKSFHGQWE